MVGTSLSHYRILEEIGRGGMGIVYKAEDLYLERLVAIKVLPPRLKPTKTDSARFRQEARAAAALNHPNIAIVHDLGQTEDGQTFIVMEYVRGETLQEKLSSGVIAVEETLSTAVEIARGLGAAHDAGIVHRDIKPGNLIVTDASVAKILDFGLAKVTDVSLSATGKRLGTVLYMSPEQARGEKVDARCDIWSMGVVLYEMLTGVRPFEAPYESAVFYAIINVDPVPPRQHVPEIPENLDKIVLKCLSKDASDRYSSASELADALLEIGEDGMLATAQLPRFRNFAGRKLGTLGKVIAPFVILLILAFSVPSIRSYLFPGMTPIPEKRGLAVLPFSNVGDDPSNLPFVDGLAHTVTIGLQELQELQTSLWVVTSLQVFNSGVSTAQEAATQHNVQLAIEGSVWLRDQRVQLTLNLVDARTGRSLRAIMIDEPIQEMILLQKTVVRKLADLLAIELSPSQESRMAAGSTIDPGALEYYLRGQGYLQRYELQGNVDLAIGRFELAVQEDSTYVQAIAGLGQAYWQKYNLTRDTTWSNTAIRYVETALSMDSGLASTNIALGETLNGQGRYELAEVAFRKALSINESNSDALKGLGLSLELQGKVEEAESTYLASIRAKPEHWVLYNNLGIFYYLESRYAEALTRFERVTQLAPDYAYGYVNLAVQYERLQQFAAAESLYFVGTTINLSANGARALAFNNLGVLRAAQDDFEQAAFFFGQSLELDSTRVSALSGLGDAYYWLGRKNESMEVYQLVIDESIARLEVNPRSSPALEDLSVAYAISGERENALDVIRTQLSLDRIDSRGLASIGTTYEILEDRNQALLYLDQSMEKGYQPENLEKTTWLDELRKDPRYLAIVQKWKSEIPDAS